MKTVFTLLVLASASLVAQTGFTPTEAQHKKLAADHEQIIKLQNQITRLQAEGQFRVARMLEDCRKIAADNHWPASTQCDVNSLVFAEGAPQQPTSAQYTGSPNSSRAQIQQMLAAQEKEEQERLEKQKAAEPKK